MFKHKEQMVRHENFIYEKKIKKSDSDFVVATINRLNKDTKECLNKASYKFFKRPFMSLKDRFQNTHMWANKEIDLLTKYEVRGKEYLSLKNI